MAVDFPNSPSVNDEFTSGTRTWIWDGSVWLLKSTLDIAVSNLNDVTLLNLADGQALLYNSTSEKWENAEVDVQGAIDTANAYTDSAVSDLTDYIDGYLDPSTGTTTDYIDQQDAATLAAANLYADTAIGDLVGTAPETLDTLSELAAAINNDPDFLSNLDALPDQTGSNGYYLTTDGSVASWAPLDISATTISETPPATPEEGDAWFRSSTGQFFVYYDSYWIEIGAGPQGEPGVVAAVAPLSYDAGTQSISIDLSSYYTSAETDAQITTAVSVKKTEVVQEVSSDINVLAGYRYVIDTTATRNLTLPPTPTVGDEIQFIDASGQAETYITNVLNNNNLINGTMDYLMLNMNFYNARLIYTGATYGWRVS